MFACLMKLELKFFCSENLLSKKCLSLSHTLPHCLRAIRAAKLWYSFRIWSHLKMRLLTDRDVGIFVKYKALWQKYVSIWWLFCVYDHVITNILFSTRAGCHSNRNFDSNCNYFLVHNLLVLLSYITYTKKSSDWYVFLSESQLLYPNGTIPNVIHSMKWKIMYVSVYVMFS